MGAHSQTSTPIDLTPLSVRIVEGDTLFTWNQRQAITIRVFLEERNQFKSSSEILKLTIREQETAISFYEESEAVCDLEVEGYKKALGISKESVTKLEDEYLIVHEELIETREKLTKERKRLLVMSGAAALFLLTTITK